MSFQPEIGDETQELVLQAAERQLHGIPVEHFLGKKIVMVDDMPKNFQMFVPLLRDLVGEEGDVVSVLHTVGDVSPSAVVGHLRDKVLAEDPDLVLMDHHLDSANNGAEVVAAIKSVRDGIVCIGFSQDGLSQKSFRQVGADGFARKNFRTPIPCLRELANVLERLA